MDNGFSLTNPQFPANNGRHITRTLIGLGNRCSILLSYGASGSFPRFPMGSGQYDTRQTRNGGLNDMARKVAQAVPDLNPIPVYRDDALIGHWTNGKIVLLEPKPVIERIPVGQRRLRHRDREAEADVTCYFIGGEHGAIKIGQTQQLEKRLRAIQSHSPITVSVLATTGGGAFTEMEYHERFAEHRLHGEWFARHPDILAEITRLTSSIGA